MGGDNPIKRAIELNTSVFTGQAQAAGQAVGAGGVSDFATGVQGTASGIADKVSGQDKVQAAAAAKKASDAADAADAENGKRALAAGNAAFASSETSRMNAGSGARTLLTGPNGLEDGNVTTSRRTLTGR